MVLQEWPTNCCWPLAQAAAAVGGRSRWVGERLEGHSNARTNFEEEGEHRLVAAVSRSLWMFVVDLKTLLRRD